MLELWKKGSTTPWNTILQLIGHCEILDISNFVHAAILFVEFARNILIWYQKIQAYAAETQITPRSGLLGHINLLSIVHISQSKASSSMLVTHYPALLKRTALLIHHGSVSVLPNMLTVRLKVRAATFSRDGTNLCLDCRMIENSTTAETQTHSTFKTLK